LQDVIPVMGRITFPHSLSPNLSRPSGIADRLLLNCDQHHCYRYF
jgi:hypothetical protein